MWISVSLTYLALFSSTCLTYHFPLTFSGRGRENKENERNLEESRGSGSGPSAGGDRDSFRRGGAGGNRGGRLSNGAGRGGGRGGSRGGPRSFSNRGGHDRGGAPFPRATSWNPEEDGSDAKSSKSRFCCLSVAGSSPSASHILTSCFCF